MNRKAQRQRQKSQKQTSGDLNQRARERSEKRSKQGPRKFIVIVLVLVGLGVLGGAGCQSFRANKEHAATSAEAAESRSPAPPSPKTESIEEAIPPAPDQDLDEIDDEMFQFDGSIYTNQRLFKREGLLDGFQDWSGKETNILDTIGGAKQMPKAAERVLDEDHDSKAMIVSLIDWQRRAPPETKDQLQYAPVAKQVRNYDGEPVGAVEYGLVFPADEDVRSPLVGAFYEYLQEEGWDQLDPQTFYNFADPRETFPTFDEPEYFKKPAWAFDEFPPIIYGTVRTGGHHMYSTTLAVNKMAWMAGFNVGAAMQMYDPILEFMEEHGMGINGPLPEEPTRDGFYRQHVPEGGWTPKSVKRAYEHPSAFSTYYSNEHGIHYGMIVNLKRWEVYDEEYSEEELADLEESLKDRHGDLETARERLEKVESQYQDFLEDHHGDLKTLNERYGENYSSWSEIPIPLPPMDKFRQLGEKVGFGAGADGDDGYWQGITMKFPMKKQLFSKHPRLLDFNRFMRTFWARRYHALDDRIHWEPVEERKIADLPIKPMEPGQDNFFFTTKGDRSAYTHREVPEFNGIGHDHPSGKTPPQYNQYMVDTYQIGHKKPVWNPEHHNYNNWNGGVQTTRYALLKDRVLGQLMDLNYQYQFNFEAGKEDLWQMHMETNHQMRRAEPAFRALYNARADADLAVLYNEANRGWNKWPEHPDRPELGETSHAYAHMGALGRPWKYVLDEDINAERVSDTLVVAAPWMTQETAERIGDLPSDRKIVSVGPMPTTDEYGQPLPNAEELQERATTVSGWENLTDEISPAEGLAEPYTTPDMAEFRWWSGYTGGVRFTLPVPKLEIRTGSRNGKDYVAIINHHWDPDKNPAYDTPGAITAPIPWAAGREIRELTTNDPEWWTYGEDETTTFEPEDVRVFELKQDDTFLPW